LKNINYFVCDIIIVVDLTNFYTWNEWSIQDHQTRSFL